MFRRTFGTLRGAIEKNANSTWIGEIKGKKSGKKREFVCDSTELLTGKQWQIIVCSGGEWEREGGELGESPHDLAPMRVSEATDRCYVSSLRIR